jgi:hypothetical protein
MIDGIIKDMHKEQGRNCTSNYFAKRNRGGNSPASGKADERRIKIDKNLNCAILLPDPEKIEKSLQTFIKRN